MERSGPIIEGKHTVPVEKPTMESSQKGFEGYGGWAHDLHCVTEYQIGAGGGLEAMLHALQQGSIGIRILQEMKLTGRIHTWYTSGYKVWETDTESRHHGGIAIIWREEAGWQVEGSTSFRPNMLSFTITSGRRRWYVVGAYLTPNNQLEVHWVMHGGGGEYNSWQPKRLPGTS